MDPCELQMSVLQARVLPYYLLQLLFRGFELISLIIGLGQLKTRLVEVLVPFQRVLEEHYRAPRIVLVYEFQALTQEPFFRLCFLAAGNYQGCGNDYCHALQFFLCQCSILPDDVMRILSLFFRLTDACQVKPVSRNITQTVRNLLTGADQVTTTRILKFRWKHTREFRLVHWSEYFFWTLI